MIYGRRPDLIPPMITSAMYGQTAGSGTVVTQLVAEQAGTSHTFTVSPSLLQQPSPVAGLPNYLTIGFDTGASLITADGQVVDGSAINNSMRITFQVPATLKDPVFEDDKADCPSGPLVATPAGAGLMGSHSCFNPDGSFNPSIFCLQELFQAAGGTQAGTGWPGSTAAAAALVQNDPQTGTPSLDATVAYLNNQAQIALYGMDLNNVGVDYPTLKAASQLMVGRNPANPCDTVNASMGPHSVECLAYLWAASGCSPAGTLSPMDANANINQANVNTALQYGSVAGIQQFYQGITTTLNSSSDYDAQDQASLACYNTSIKQTVITGSNPPEVFQVQSPTGNYQVAQGDAAATCAIFGAQVATMAQMTQANQEGYETCTVGWVADSNTAQVSITSLADVQGCGNGLMGVLPWTSSSNLANVNCYGVKPVPGTENVLPFNSQQWSLNLLPGQNYTSGAPNPGVPVPS